MTTYPVTHLPVAVRTTEKSHRRLLTLMSLTVLAAALVLALYGRTYYRLGPTERAFSPEHHLLKPSGEVGLSLGFLGVLMLCGIFLYPLRKRWAWLQRLGHSQHWLDHHILFGIAAPLCIAFHASFKFHGLAGIAFWTMVAVAISGLVGRYLYAQVLREEAAAKASLLDFGELLGRQRIVSQAELRRVFPLPPVTRIPHWSSFTALGYLILSDVLLPFRLARLRMKFLRGPGAAYFKSLGGFRPIGHARFEDVLHIAAKQARLCRRILLLSQARQVFKLWHVVHRPFSYAFATLALIHICIAMLFGFV